MTGADAPPKLALAAIGLLAGFIAGLFGVGGGILIAPGLMLLGGLPQRLAHGTSLATSAVLAVAGIAAYSLSGSVDVIVALLIFAGSSLGVLAGVDLLNRIRMRTLQVAFVVLLGVAAGRLLAGTPAGTGDLSVTVPTAFALVGCGILVGLLAGLLGIGGGVIVVPALVLLFEVVDVTAKGTSLLVVLPTAVVGTLRNMRHGNVDLRSALVTGAGGVVSAFGGALLAGIISPELSTALFAGLLLAIAARMLDRLFRSARPSAGGSEEVDPPGSAGGPEHR